MKRKEEHQYLKILQLIFLELQTLTVQFDYIKKISKILKMSSDEEVQEIYEYCPKMRKTKNKNKSFVSHFYASKAAEQSLKKDQLRRQCKPKISKQPKRELQYQNQQQDQQGLDRDIINNLITPEDGPVSDDERQETIYTQDDCEDMTSEIDTEPQQPVYIGQSKYYRCHGKPVGKKYSKKIQDDDAQEDDFANLKFRASVCCSKKYGMGSCVWQRLKKRKIKNKHKEAVDHFYASQPRRIYKRYKQYEDKKQLKRQMRREQKRQGRHEHKLHNNQRIKKTMNKGQLFQQAESDYGSYDDYEEDYSMQDYQDYNERQNDSYCYAQHEDYYDDYQYYDYYDDYQYYDYYDDYQYYDYNYYDYYDYRPKYSSSFRYDGLAFGQYGNSSYPWWNPTGLNTWERFYLNMDD